MNNQFLVGKADFNYDLNFIISVLIIIIVPSIMFVFFKLTSLALGLCISSLLVVLINWKIAIYFRFSLGPLVLFLMCFIVLLLNSFYNYYVFGTIKQLSSLIFSLVIFSAFIFSRKINSIKFKTLSNSYFVVLVVLLALGWLSVLCPIKVGAYALAGKPVFPFVEESHYALSLGLIAVGYVTNGGLKSSLFVSANLFFFSLFFPSLTMLLFAVLCVFMLLLRLKKAYFMAIFLVVILLAVPVAGTLLSSSDYFASRLSFSDSKNRTTLVFLQGWSLAYVNLIETTGFGLGFQMLGSSKTHLSPFTDMIKGVYGGRNSNLSDGGLLASKIIAEFGIVGLYITLMYLAFLIKYIFNNFKTRMLINNNWSYYDISKINKKILLSGMLFGYLVEFFFRGYGYFSPGLYLVLAILGSDYSLIFTSGNKFIKNVQH